MIGIKEFNKKIVSLKNTRKVTKTMKMVSASKFKRAHKAQSAARFYADRLGTLMARLASNCDNKHPLMEVRATPQNALIVLISSDKGLCGGFNNGLIRFVQRHAQNDFSRYAKVEYSFCGRRGYMALRRTMKINQNYENTTAKPSWDSAAGIAGDLSKAFLDKAYDEVYLAYNRFNNQLSQTPVIEKILPLNTTEIRKQTAERNAMYLYEPGEEDLYNLLVPKFLNFKIYYALLENAAGEHGARMSAMDKASQSTTDLIERYTLLRNRVRQAAITTELIEIISGAEALK